MNPATRPTTLRSLSAFGDLAVASLACLVIALLLGLLAGALLRRRRLAWSWALLTLAPLAIWIGAVALGLLALAVAAPLLSAIIGMALGSIGWGAHAQLEARRAGGDREAATRELLTPLDLVRRRRAFRPPSSPEANHGELPIGRGAKGELASVPRGSARSGAHLLIPGATGAGKSTSLAAVLVDYVARSGFGAIVLEAKADATLLESARAAAQLRGARFHLFSPQGSASYDPLAHGSVDERSERLIAVESWGSGDADFYRLAASPFLRAVLRGLDQCPEPSNLANVARHCDPDELANLALALDGEAAAQVTATLGGLRADQKRAIAGLRARLENLASSDLARDWLDPQRPGAETFDLRNVIERREVAYFRFDTDRTGNVGRAIAQMVLLDLGAAASELMGRGVGAFVAIDEFGALEAPALDRLYARGRAAGFSVSLGTQTLADLRAAGPAVRERIGATVSGLICHRIGEQADAEWVAELIGAIPAWQSTIRTDGLGLPTDEGTRTRGYRFEVNPSELQRLPGGEAYVARLDQSGTTRARRAQVVPPWKRLARIRDAA